MHGFSNAVEAAKRFDDPSRDEWQKPDQVLQEMQLSPDMIIADIGAGTGYFAVRLAGAVPQGEVIATDSQASMVKYLEERARREQLHNLRAVQASETSSGLKARSVDRILIVNVWHHLANRVSYARDLAMALRAYGKLFIIDYQLDAQNGPPISMRLAAEVIVSELKSAGFVAKISRLKLPDQYLIEADLNK